MILFQSGVKFVISLAWAMWGEIQLSVNQELKDGRKPKKRQTTEENFAYTWYCFGALPYNMNWMVLPGT
jgi:hypothetical protein